MSLRLPSRYEDLDDAFRGRLKANADLLDKVKRSFSSMQVSGGIRFLPIYGESGSGKTSAALEIGTHLPEVHVVKLSRASVEDQEILLGEISVAFHNSRKKFLVAVIDQYEEAAAQRAAVPTTFIEKIALLDRGELRNTNVMFCWLTTSKTFQKDLVDATSRNRRILVQPDFEIVGPAKQNWPSIIEETFRFHNQDKDLSDYEIIDVDLMDVAHDCATLGSAIEKVGERLFFTTHQHQDLSSYQVVMLWPVTDGLRITRILQFTDARQGYKLDWNAWYRQLNAEDQRQLPLRELNRARLYFELRLVPVAAADLHRLCKDLDKKEVTLAKTYMDRFRNTHFFSIISGNWNADAYSPLRERESKRAENARIWYSSVTDQPTKIGRRIAKCLTDLGVSSASEQEVQSPHSRVRADVLVDRTPVSPPKVIIELKAFSPENTMPSSICEAVKTTLRRHAQFAGFLARQ